MPFWLKFKWRMAHSRNRGTWNREPPPPTLDSRFGGVLHLPHSPLLQLHPLAASSTSSDFASIPHIPFSHPSTLPPLQPPCLLHFASTPYIPLSIHRSIHTCTSAISLPPPLRLITLPSTLPSIHTCTSAISLPRPLRLNTLHYILHPSAPPPRAPPRPPSTPPTAPPSPRRRSRGARRAPRRRSLRRHC